MPGFCYIYRDYVTEEDSCTHTNEKHTSILTCICIYKDSDFLSDDISS